MRIAYCFFENKYSTSKYRKFSLDHETFSNFSTLRSNKFSQSNEIQIKVDSYANAIKNCVVWFAHISAFLGLQRNNETFHSCDFTSQRVFTD